MMRKPALPILPIALAALLGLAPAAASGAAAGTTAADIPAPSDRELTQFLTIEKELTSDPSRAAELCALMKSENDPSVGDDPLLAKAGRLLEAKALYGPALRHQAISGQRFLQVSLQTMGGMLALGMADSMDKTAREKGQPAESRSGLLRKSPEARAVAPRQSEISAVLETASKLCEEEGEGDDESGEGEGGDEGDGDGGHGREAIR